MCPDGNSSAHMNYNQVHIFILFHNAFCMLARDRFLIQCVENTLDLMVPKAAEKDIELTCEMSSDVPPVVRGDAGRLRQILLNLLSNALKFTHEGEVGISVAGKPVGERYELFLSVHDTGIGVEQGKLDSIFEAL